MSSNDTSNLIFVARKAIDQIDRQIVQLLARRYEVVDTIFARKSEMDVDRTDTRREQEILDRVEEVAEKVCLSEGFVRNLFCSILAHSKNRDSDISLEECAVTIPDSLDPISLHGDEQDEELPEHEFIGEPMLWEETTYSDFTVHAIVGGQEVLNEYTRCCIEKEEGEVRIYKAAPEGHDWGPILIGTYEPGEVKHIYKDEPIPDSGFSPKDFEEGQRVFNICTERANEVKDVHDDGSVLVDDPKYERPLVFAAQHLHPHPDACKGEDDGYGVDPNKLDVGYRWMKSEEYGPELRTDHVVQVVQRLGEKLILRDSGYYAPFPDDAEWGAPVRQ